MPQPDDAENGKPRIWRHLLAFAQFRANGGITNRMLPRVINELAGWEYEPDSDESGAGISRGKQGPALIMPMKANRIACSVRRRLYTR